jgi:hypothetical protein
VSKPADGPPPSPAIAVQSGPSLDDLWSEFEAERQRVAKLLRIELIPLAAHDHGRHDLAHALASAKASGHRDLEIQRVRRAIAVAAAEAEGYRDSQWLTGAVFTPNNLRRLSSTTSERARQAAAERRAAADRVAARACPAASAPAPRRKDPPPAITKGDDPAVLLELAAAARASLYGSSDLARAPPAGATPTESPDDEQPEPAEAT